MNDGPRHHIVGRSDADKPNPDPIIPEKTYFRIGEVCEIAGLKQHVLRYWESEFKELIRPRRASSKQRLYRREDVEAILRIKKLLREEGFTIPGARKALLDRKNSPVPGEKGGQRQDARDLLATIKAELQGIQRLLEER